jgi:Protein of unknown function (DUF3631)
MTSPRPAEGAVILGELHDILTRYVILPSAEAVIAVALWIAATHAQASWAHAPRLVIRAPEKRCGKSRLLDVVEGTCHAPLITVNATPAAVYRAIGGDIPPTLLVDEADTIFGGKNAEGNEDLRGLLNAGHQRNRPAIRWDHTTRRLETIPTFAMAALAGIGAMPDTIEDRAVVIRMRRRAPGETVAPFRHRRDRPALTTMATTLAGWLARHLAELEKAEPPMPLEDRAADTWEPLIAVADLAGGDWPRLARHAAVVLTSDRDEAADISDRIRLLTDCRTAFGTADALPTLLREYDIRSATIRFGEPTGQAKGYYRADFADAWARYCTEWPGEPSQPSQASPASSEAVRLPERYGSSRTTRQGVPGQNQDLTSGNTEPGTTGTAGTTNPRLYGIDGGAA